MGDPAGVGPQITWQAWAARKPGQRPFYVIGGVDVLAAAQRMTGIDGRIRQIRSPEESGAFNLELPVFPIEAPNPAPGKPDLASAGAIIKSIETAVEHVCSGRAAAVVTNPIAKALLYRTGFRHPGHTEFLAELASEDGASPRPVMMLTGGGLRVALVTIHKPLASVVAAISSDLVAETGQVVHAALQRDFGITAPRLGLCGINPHAGEEGELGKEEIEIVNPAAARLRAEGVDISDARPGDTIFHEALQGRYDAVVAMYHDQGLIPVKTLDLWGGVNDTLGLPFIRTSPDHGVAYDAAASGKAKPNSLIAALEIADKMALARARA
jgi:4-hydroxythreonine-4-phosphate dehydrogenase